MKKLSNLIFVMWILVCQLLYAATIIRVPQDRPTIQEGIDAAVDEDIVLVADGIYNEIVVFNGKKVTVTSENGHEFTTIGGKVKFINNEDHLTQLKGFTLQKGILCGAVFFCPPKEECPEPASGSPTISNCVITDNSMSFQVGIYCDWGSNPIIRNCLIINTFSVSGAGVFCSNNSSPQLINCTIANNHIAGVRSSADSSPIITNCILWNNDPQQIKGDAVVTYSDIQEGWPGEGNIDVDPLFVDVVNEDYHLDDFSPCIGKATAEGAPTDDIEENPRGTPPDIGAYENPLDVSLPVELSAFSGTIAPDGILLKWRTESETNNLGFHIYRSKTKDGNYVRITPVFIKGQGSDSTPYDYRFLDETAEEGQSYWYLIEDIDFSGITGRFDPIQVVFSRKAVPPKVLPTHFALYQNYPNPFNPETWMPYDLASSAEVTITIYNAQVQRIRTLLLGIQPAGSHLTKDRAAYWDGRGDTGEPVSSGIYFYHLQVGDFYATKKMIILK